MNAYLAEQLNATESVVYECNFSFFGFISTGIFVLAVLIGSISIGIETGNVAIIGIGVLIALIPVIHMLLVLKTTVIAFTTKRVIGKVGILSRDSLDAPLSKINNISVKKGLIGMIFNYGTIKISTSSGHFSFKYIDKPEIFKTKFFAQVE
jgi:uncharacterized membrane protein YdbT with pleckstrin-like domain